MSSILAGVFQHHSDYKKLEADLENSGFGNSDYIVYLNDPIHNSSYMASVVVKDLSEIDKAKNVFNQNAVFKTYIFENMSIDQADYAHLKSYINARNKAEIHDSPDVKIKTSNTGMDSEVKF
ncbi:hypothetical protein D1631_09590 [Chryseobacterium nematophagum]|uniref:Uncharacterized protein n=2 Tax=Chryseobacterium TaxID=59732 RepID=A0A3M7LB99_9FLAO|nr:MULTISPECIES: hypothetical protein [Chryseobacterium]RMZ59817.1 hypothetical protein D1632_09400 [Chryseobacterium nematophagum]RNA62166.1 hypothetical protein D1631_09590 [Chryseobacterium nematophagum]CAA7194526.1 hypothetical protein CHRY9293_00838 [Chryseobacterium potabilaquae]